MTDFVHLRLRSEYSLLDGACRIKEIPKAAAALGQKAVAVTDRGVLYGAVAFSDACRNEGVKPIIGCEVFLCDCPRTECGRDTELFSLILLAKNMQGYKNLIKIVSGAQTEGMCDGEARVDTDLLRDFSEGLICLSGGTKGKISSLLMDGRYKEADSLAVSFERIFGNGNFYLELQNGGAPGEAMACECLLGVHERTGIPLVCTNDVRYLSPSDADTHNALLCIRDGKTPDAASDVNNGQHLKSGDEMASVFGKFGEAVENTLKIASMCDLTIEEGKTVLPDFTPPDGMTPSRYLRSLTFDGLETRAAKGQIRFDSVHGKDEYTARIEYELLVIRQMGYDSYFLIVADFVNYAKSVRIPTGPGRGSGAGSLVAYLIGITEVDPVVYGLLFEAFLNRERISMPDFDIDFGDRRRDEVIRYVERKYGRDCVAQITTFGTMAEKAALRDAGRILGMDKHDVDSIIRALPEAKGKLTISDALTDPDFSALCDENPDADRLVSLAKSLEGLPRNASTHAAGVVITPRPVCEYVPVIMNGDAAVTQYDMDTIARLGLLKFDFLAIRYLTVIDDAEKFIRKNEKNFSVDSIPLDDGDTFDLISSGKTDGLFQLESPGITRMLKKMRPAKITDLMVAIALYRPGPMDSIETFIKNKNSGTVSYKIPVLADILGETCGCIVYQEQVMEIFRAVAGYSYGRADVVRRAIAKKKPGVIEKELDGFIAGAKNRGYTEEDVRELYSEMTDFANYAFKKSHAAAYGIVSYRTAYLKTHYPAEYYSALLSSVSGDTGKSALYMERCGQLGVRILPPDVNRGGSDFRPDKNAVIFGLSSIKGVGEAFASRIEQERENGDFTSLESFIGRMSGAGMTRMQTESLIKAGAFDGFGKTRSAMLAVYGEIISRRLGESRGAVQGQLDMFGGEPEKISWPDLPELPLREKLAMEKELCGIAFSGHLLDGYSECISDIPHADLSELDPGWDKKQITVCAMLTKCVRRTTKKGETMLTCTAESRFRSVPAVIFPKAYESCAPFAGEGSAVRISASVQAEDEGIKLFVNSLEPLIPNGKYVRKIQSAPAPSPEKEQPRAKRLFIRVPSLTDPAAKRIKALTVIFSDGGTTPVILFDSSTGKYVPLGINTAASPFLTDELAVIAGKNNVILK